MTRARLLLLWLGVVACGRPAAPRPGTAAERWHGSLAPRPAPGAVVVAEVNGDPIYDVDVARQAATRGVAPRAALDELVAAQLLAQEAARRGLADDPEVAAARKRERVRRLMELDFVSWFDGPEDVPMEAVLSAWRNPKVHEHFHHPEKRDVGWVRVEAAEDADPRAAEEARRRAEHIRAELAAAPPAGVEDFHERARAAAGVPELPHGRITTPRHGVAVEPFAAAAFAIPAVGGLSPVTRTRWGFDVLYLAAIEPAVDKSFEQAEPEIREGIFDMTRQASFENWANRLVAGAHVERSDDDDALLERVAVQSPFGPR